MYNNTLADSVGIGTTTPGQKLNVFGNIRQSGAGFYTDLIINPTIKTWSVVTRVGTDPIRTQIEVDGDNNRVTI